MRKVKQMSPVLVDKYLLLQHLSDIGLTNVLHKKCVKYPENCNIASKKPKSKTDLVVHGWPLLLALFEFSFPATKKIRNILEKALNGKSKAKQIDTT